MIDVAVLRAMAAAGATVEMILAAVEAAQAVEQEKLEQRRAKDAERKRRSRGLRRTPQDSAGQSVTPRDTADTVLVSPPSPPSMVSPNTPSLTPPSPTSSPTNTRARGSRIADDWEPSDNDLKFAGDHGIRLIEIELEAAKFRDYWRARAGPNGVKLDWSATWRNWIRKALESGKGRGNGAANPTMDAFDRLIARAEGNDVDAGATILDITPGRA